MPPPWQASTEPSAEEVSSPVKVYAPLSFPVIAALIPFSIFGVLARLGIEAIATYDGQSIFTLAWVQAFGCVFMGFFLELKQPIGDFYGPLYTGLTTGFCGSLTTFSSWQVDVFISWANTSGFHRDWFRDVIDGLAKTLATFAISIFCVEIGVKLAKPIVLRLPKPIPQAKSYVRSGLPIISVLMYAATLPTYFLMSPAFRHKATAALLFAFPGALLRYLLSIFLNTRTKFMPLGTFTANILGTALLGMFRVLQRTPHLPSPTRCAILQGLSDGFCGCLTTVSTFAVELTVLRGPVATRYAAISWTVSQLVLLVIFGPSWWAGGVNDSVECSFAVN